jgi:hypothetical protein
MAAPLLDLPGGDLVDVGLKDLAAGRESVDALLVASFSTRLRRLGLPVPQHTIEDPEMRLYRLLEQSLGNGAHARYNALIRRVLSFSNSYRCAKAVDATRVRAFMKALGEATRAEGRVYFSGGTSAVLEGWRRVTVDVDIEAVPQSDPLLQAIPGIKESLNINVELASPAHFIPPLPNWQDRCRFIERVGLLDFFHYDFYSQALSKVQRGLERDLEDVRAMVERALVTGDRAWTMFRRIEPQLYRYPGLDPESFCKAVEAAFGPEQSGDPGEKVSDRDRRSSL